MLNWTSYRKRNWQQGETGITRSMDDTGECFWPGLCTEHSRPSSSVTTVSWAVDRHSSSAVGSTISMELRGEDYKRFKLHLWTQNTVFFLSCLDKQRDSLTHQRHKRMHRLDVCEFAARVSFLNSPLVHSFPCWWWPLVVVLCESEKLWIECAAFITEIEAFSGHSHKEWVH